VWARTVKGLLEGVNQLIDNGYQAQGGIAHVVMFESDVNEQAPEVIFLGSSRKERKTDYLLQAMIKIRDA